jgi:hypothetical protein
MHKFDVLNPATAIFQRWWVQLLAMAAVILGAKLWLISAFASPTPFFDQWNGEAAWLFKPYVEGTFRIGALLAAHNEHRILWSRLLDIVLLELNGRWDPIIEMTVNALLHVAALVGLVAMLGATLGRGERLALVVTTAILFALPFGWENTIAGFQSPFYFLLLFSLACFHCGVDAPAFSVRWWGAMALGVGAYFAMALGALTLVPLITVHALQMILCRRIGWREYVAITVGIAVVVLMLTTIPTVEHHAALRAHSIWQFASAFFEAIAWPLSVPVARFRPPAGWALLLNLAAAVLVNIPILTFTWTRARHHAGDRNTIWTYLLVGLWTAVQAASLAYGRAGGVLSARYLDLLTMSIILNLACLLKLVHLNVGYPINRAATAWGMAIVAIVTVLSFVRLPREVLERWHYTQQQTSNISAFLATGDSAHLIEKPLLAIPYPSAEDLINLANDPSIRSILPEDIMPTAEASTRNPNLLLGGPLYGLFHVVRRVLPFLGIVCLTAGSLVFVCAGYILQSRFGGRPRPSRSD